MTASVFASFLVFLLTGAYAFNRCGLPFPSGGFVKLVVFGTLLVNALFFFYFEAYTESDVKVRQRLRKIGPSEWALRAVAQLELFLLWFALQFGWPHYLITLVVLHVTYVAWDMLVWDAFPDKTLLWLGLLGLLLSVTLYIAMYFLGKHPNVDPVANSSWMMLLGIVAAGFVGIVIYGVNRIRYNPFCAL
jgi:hypothetical protein